MGRFLELARGKPPEEEPSQPAKSAPATTPLASSTVVLDAMLVLGCWKTTLQIAEAVNRSFADIRPVLDELLAAGTIERDGGPIFIWQATLEERLRHHGALIAIDRQTAEALPLFRAGDADIVKDVADVYLTFEIELTPEQRADLTASLDYYERISTDPNLNREGSKE